MEDPNLLGLEAELFSTAKAMADAKRRLGESRESAWEFMVGPKYAGTQIETIFDIVWPVGS